MPDARTLPTTDSFLQDLRYAFRTLRRDAGFTAFAILIVGLGIGASATVFSVVNTLLLRPLPFASRTRLVWMANHDSSGLSGQTTQVAICWICGNTINLSPIWPDISRSTAWATICSAAQGEPERLSGVPVSDNFFPAARRPAADRPTLHRR